MAEPKTNISLRIGFERMKYLDMANIAFAEQNWTGCRGYLDAFLETIPETTKAATEIKELLNEIETTRTNQRNELNNTIKNMGYLEQRDLTERGNTQIEIEYVHSQKTICWKVALTHGLFNE